MLIPATSKSAPERLHTPVGRGEIPHGSPPPATGSDAEVLALRIRIAPASSGMECAMKKSLVTLGVLGLLTLVVSMAGAQPGSPGGPPGGSGGPGGPGGLGGPGGPGGMGGPPPMFGQI